jgi:hypothetical protein
VESVTSSVLGEMDLKGIMRGPCELAVMKVSQETYPNVSSAEVSACINWDRRSRVRAEVRRHIVWAQSVGPVPNPVAADRE